MRPNAPQMKDWYRQTGQENYLKRRVDGSFKGGIKSQLMLQTPQITNKEVFPQQRKLKGSSAQINSGVFRCGSQEQVPEAGSGRFRRVPVCAGVGSGGRFRNVPVCAGGSGEFRTVPVCAGVGSGSRFRKVPGSSGVLLV